METFCEIYGHIWMLMKAYGRTYMECEKCKVVRPVTADDLRKIQ